MTEKNFLVKTLTDTVISRRSFLKWSAVVGGSAVLAGSFTSCSPQVASDQNPSPATTGKETTASVFCPNMGCHQNCAILAHLRDGQLVSVSAPDFPGIPEFRHICIRGLSSWKLPYLDNRINYPMKRVGERGSGQWARITWEEALDTIANKMVDIKNQYGPEGVMLFTTGSSAIPILGINSGAAMARFSNLFGSSELIGWQVDGAPRLSAMTMFGFFYSGGNDPRLWKNSKLILNWGKNSAETALREYKLLMDARDQGAKLVQIGVNYDVTSAKADQWIPIEPASDAALAMGMMNIILRDGLEDKNYLIYSTVAPLLVNVETGAFAHGPDLAPNMDKALYLVWDETSNGPVPMPPHTHEMPGVTPALDGEYTIGGKKFVTAFHLLKAEIEKFPPKDMATITGLSTETIENLAHEYAASKPAAIIMGQGFSRYYNGELAARAILTLAAITGNVGVSGGGASCDSGEFNPTLNSDAICAVDERRSKRVPIHLGLSCVTEGKPFQVKAMLVSTYNFIHTIPSHDEWVEKVLPNLDLLVTLDIVESETARWSDIILPAASIYERRDIGATLGYAVLNHQAIQPLFERKSDLDICKELANRLGFGDQFAYTEDDFIKVMLQNDTLKGVTLDRLESEGGLVYGNAPQDPAIPFAKQDYWTTSGRIEFYAEQFAGMGMALPTYKGPIEAKDSELGKKYPLRFISGKRRFWTQTMSFYPRRVNSILSQP